MKGPTDDNAVRPGLPSDPMPEPLARALSALPMRYLFIWWVRSHFGRTEPAARFLGCNRRRVNEAIVRLEATLGTELVYPQDPGRPSLYAPPSGYLTPAGKVLFDALTPFFRHQLPAALAAASKAAQPHRVR